MDLQYPLFGVRLVIPCRRRIVSPTGEPARFRLERLNATLVHRVAGDMVLAQFDGERRDGSARGCLLQVRLVTARRGLAAGALLASAMKEARHA